MTTSGHALPGNGAPLTRRILGGQVAMYAYVVLAVLVLWTVLAASGLVQPLLLPLPTDAFAAFGALLAQPAALLATLAETAYSVVLAFAIAAVAGILLGLLVGSRQILFEAYEPLFAHLNAVPLVLLYPLLLGALGSGPAAKIVIGALVTGLAVAIATQRAARAVDPDLLTAARSMGAGGTVVARSVVLPAIAPGVFAGLRAGLGLTIVTVVAGEFLSATAGLGFELAQTSEAFQTPALFAWLIVTLLFTAASIGLLTVIEALITRRINR